MQNKKYNHAFAIAFSLDSNLSTEEWEKHMQTEKGLAELGAHCINRVMHIVADKEFEAYDLCDSVEH